MQTFVSFGCPESRSLRRGTHGRIGTSEAHYTISDLQEQVKEGRGGVGSEPASGGGIENNVSACARECAQHRRRCLA